MGNEPLSKKELRRRKRRRSLIGKSIVLVLLLVILGVAVFFLVKSLKEDRKDAGQSAQAPVEQTEGEDASQDVETGGEAGEGLDGQNQEGTQETGQETDRTALMEEAAYLAATYDYDGAIEKLNSIPGAEQDAEVTAKIAEYQATKDSCVAVNPEQVTHIFYHSLVVDPERGFAGNDSIAAGFKQWMTTVDEFNKITQTMYDNGYVLVRLRDLVVETTDENGQVHFAPNTNLMLPPGKKAFVLSLDDLSYYHSYDGRGLPQRWSWMRMGILPVSIFRRMAPR